MLIPYVGVVGVYEHMEIDITLELITSVARYISTACAYDMPQ